MLSYILAESHMKYVDHRKKERKKHTYAKVPVSELKV